MVHTAETLQAAFHYLFPSEVPALKQLAQILPPNPVVVNIGAGAGTSGLAFLESRPDLQLITVDIQSDSSPFGCLYAEKMIFVEAGIPDGRYTQVCADSIGYGLNFDQKCDMVFIDGDHSYEGCKGDILTWLPNIKPGGILAIHDYHKAELFRDEFDFQPDKPHPKPWPGVDQAVDELLLGKYEKVLGVDSLIAFRVGAV